MSRFNRERQRTILGEAAVIYPEWLDCSHGVAGSTAEEAHADVRYLAGHDLIEIREAQYLDQTVEQVAIRPTSRGIDFLEDDGGLSAILGVVTIKLHDDTLKSLIEARILQSDLPQPDKKRWLDQLRELPAETTKHLVLKLVDLGLANGPAAIAAIGTYLSK